MLFLLFLQTALAGSVTATVEVSAEGLRVVDAVHVERPALALPGLEIAVTDATGNWVRTAGFQDPRFRSVSHPPGEGPGGQTTFLERSLIRVDIPWTAGDSAVATTLGSFTPRRWAAPPTDERAVLIHGNDNPAERLDLVIFADGYTELELGQFATDADRVVTALFETEPWSRYTSLVNIWRVDRASEQSGAGTGEGLEGSAYACHYSCNGLERLVCCDEELLLSEINTLLPEAEGALVLVNDPRYGGSGGANYAATTSRHSESRSVALHELGHTLVGLWDEYSYGVPGDPAFDGEGPNCSSSDENVPWTAWETEADVDRFLGCSYTNYYRPTDHSCMMYSLQDQYCHICRQEAIFATYARTPGLVSSISPAPQEPLDVDRDGRVTFTVESIGPEEGLAYDWYIGDERVAQDTLSPDLSCLPRGADLTLRAYDKTPWVRDDPYGLTWNLLGPWTVPATPQCSDGCGCAGIPRTGVGVLWPLGLGLLFLRRRNKQCGD